MSRTPKLGEADVYRILQLRKRGKTFTDIGRMLGVHAATVCRAVQTSEARSDPKLAAKIDERTDGNFCPNITNHVLRVEKMDESVRFLIAAEIAKCFLNEAQIAMKHGVTQEDVRAIRREIARGVTFPRPPGLVEFEDDVKVTDDRRESVLRASMLQKAQEMVDAVTEEKITDLTGDKLVSSAERLAKTAADLGGGKSGGGGVGALVSRARNVLFVTGAVDTNRVTEEIMKKFGYDKDDVVVDADAEDDPPPALPAPSAGPDFDPDLDLVPDPPPPPAPPDPEEDLG